MLIKLLKHEWIAVRGFLFCVCISMIISTVISGTTFYTPLWNSNNDVSNIIAAILLAFNLLTLAVGSFATYIYCAIRFYKNLFQDEGYLMHTLPVKSWQLILSKLVLASILQIVTFITLLFSMFGLLYSSTLRFNSCEEWQNHFQIYFTSEFQLLIKEINLNLPMFIVLILICSFVSIISSILTIYVSISIGQVFSKSKILFSIITYFVINIVVQFFTTILLTTLNITNISDVQIGMSNNLVDEISIVVKYLSDTMIVSVIISIIFCIMFYILTNYFMSHKLNLE
ncbi:MAG: hypothetical protein ACRC7V_09560 [Lachnospiraceae bacterium]